MKWRKRSVFEIVKSYGSHLGEGVAELKRRGILLGFCERAICRREAPAS